MNDLILRKINLINKYIDSTLDGNSDISLFNGLGGMPIFYYLQYKLSNDEKYIKKIHDLFEKIIGLINETDIKISYCNGLIGVAHMFNYIRKKGVLEIEALEDIEEALLTIDSTIIDFSIENTWTIDDSDFLHGSFGAAFYLIERLQDNQDELFKEKVILLVEKLAQIVILDVEKTKKVKGLIDYDDDTHLTNCGLAHGNVSHILIFSKFLENVPENELIKNALIDTVECLLGFETESENSFSKFPGIAVNKITANYNISLGWCYGDQTISLALYKASKILNRKDLEEKAFYLAYANLKRNSGEKMFRTQKYDACFCHGLSSVAYIHKKWYLISKDEIFFKEYERYILDILNFGENQKGIAGYQKFAGKDGYIDCVGFLDGVLGIGTVFLDYLLEFDDCGWDNFFLLDVN